jgi:mono/diheme cytochrome c family protein
MMRRMIVPAVVLAFGFAGAAAADEAAKGKALMSSVTPKCTTCHTDTKNPLAKAGAENTKDELKAWIRTPKEMMTKRGKKGMMPAFPPEKISDADLNALVDYLAAMK